MILGRIQKTHASIQYSWQYKLKLLLLIILFTGSIFAFNKIKNAHEFRIKHVKVYGVKHVDHLAVQRLLLPLVSKGFFGIEIETIKERLQQMPWIADVSVRRIWPDQVVITVAERNPIARWNHKSLLSSGGEIFSPEIKSYPEDLPQLIGPDGAHLHMLEYYSKIKRLLLPLNFKIDQLELTPYASWNLTLAGGMKVHLGYKDILTRIHHFVKVYPKIVGERATDVEYVDLRYPNGLAVRWKTV